MGIGGNLEMWGPFEGSLDARRADHHCGRPGHGWLRLLPLASPDARACPVMDRMLQALGYDEVDVLGVSFGGVLAQQLAHQAPDRVRRLVLAATGAGWVAYPARPRFSALATPRRYTQPDYFRRIAGTIYGGDVRRDPDAILHGSLARFTKPPSMCGYLAQLFAITGWTSLPWLGRLRPPTLVLAGDDDPIVPASEWTDARSTDPGCAAARGPRRRPPLPARAAREMAALVTEFLK